MAMPRGWWVMGELQEINQFYRLVTGITEEEVGVDVTLSCGHVSCVIGGIPKVGTLYWCAECLHEWLEK